ncbi:transcription factor bHLH110 isoform X2 [Manihot esculenta]|uniref:transcription factor bHLH110 isoform X2 n=1 Tax=Manihot esculenta TaxID=3983 RepID=UPI001CC7725D|nr:transcription factor bHLH110 isoform X2 [Manihot esculenta]
MKNKSCIIMESANLHHQHHQLQLQLVGSSSLTTPSSNYGAGSTLSSSNLNPNCNGVDLNPRQKNEFLIPSLNSSTIQNLGLIHWNSNSAGCFTNQSADHDLQLAKIKQDLPDSFPRFTDMLNDPSTVEDSHLSSPSYEQKHMTDLSEKLLLKTISSGFPINVHQFSSAQIYSNAHDCSSPGSSIPRRGNFSQIYPSINISNLNRSPPSISGAIDMNLQALDHLNSTRFSRSIGQPSHDNLGMYNDSISYDLEHMHIPSSSPIQTSSFTTNEILEAKRPSDSLMEPKATQAAATKKSRLETRASCPPFKVCFATVTAISYVEHKIICSFRTLIEQVRKEKLGDRIAALQQLVAPFGKTDTASVLMEAIGYIKFLQNQVETLSVPYMKSSRNKASTRITQEGSTEEGKDELKTDLRSRGLCLVPLSCMSYVTADGGGGGGGGIWPPPNFGGGT